MINDQQQFPAHILHLFIGTIDRSGGYYLDWHTPTAAVYGWSFQNRFNPRWRRIAAAFQMHIFHTLFSSVSIIFGQHNRAWWVRMYSIGLSCRELVYRYKLFRPAVKISVSFIPKSPQRINSSILNGTFSLGSQDLIKRGCCLNLTCLLCFILALCSPASSVYSHGKFTSDLSHSFFFLLLVCSQPNCSFPLAHKSNDLSKISLMALICPNSECTD